MRRKLKRKDIQDMREMRELYRNKLYKCEKDMRIKRDARRTDGQKKNSEI